MLMAIRESICPVGCSEDTHLACTLGTSKTSPFHSYQGVQVPVQAQTLSPHIAGPASVWCLDLLNPIYITTLKAGPKRDGTHNKRETSLPASISKYMLGTSRSMT
jgi:hypothetical protein